MLVDKDTIAVKEAVISWYDIEKRYAKLFPSKTVISAKPLQMALGLLNIQKQYDISVLLTKSVLRSMR